MYINRVINHQYFTELYSQDYLKAYQARLDTQKELNDAIKTQATSPFYETLGYEDAFSYLEAESNLYSASIYSFNTGLSKYQQSLIDLSNSLISAQEALISYQRAQEEETETEAKTIVIGEQEVELILENEDDDGSKRYSTDPTTLEISNYTVENLVFETFYDENNKINVRSSAELLLGDSEFELNLSENSSGNYIFKLQSNELYLESSDLTIYDVFLSENGLEFKTEISQYNSSKTLSLDDQAIISTLELLENRYGPWTTGSTEQLISDAKSAKNSIIDQFISQSNELNNFELRQNLLSIQINSIFEEDNRTSQSSQFLAYLLK